MDSKVVAIRVAVPATRVPSASLVAGETPTVRLRVDHVGGHIRIETRVCSVAASASATSAGRPWRRRTAGDGDRRPDPHDVLVTSRAPHERRDVAHRSLDRERLGADATPVVVRSHAGPDHEATVRKRGGQFAARGCRRGPPRTPSSCPLVTLRAGRSDPRVALRTHRACLRTARRCGLARRRFGCRAG